MAVARVVRPSGGGSCAVNLLYSAVGGIRPPKRERSAISFAYFVRRRLAM